ncbi:hypothetical protein ILUMI_13966, partial [Ignelater luminosus]
MRDKERLTSLNIVVSSDKSLESTEDHTAQNATTTTIVLPPPKVTPSTSRPQKPKHVINTRNFTKNKRGSLAILKDGKIDINQLKGNFFILTERHESLTTKNASIYEPLLGDDATTEQQTDEELSKANEYNIEFIIIKEKVKLLEKDMPVLPSADSHSSDPLLKHALNYKLSKMKFRQFGGEIKDWLPFWDQFQKIHNEEKMHPSDKLHCLLMSITPNSVAKEPLVSSCLPVEILRTWDRKGRGAEFSSKVMLESLLEFLKYEVEGDQKIAMALDGFGFKNCKETIQREVPTAAGLLTTVKDQPKEDCIFCYSGHRSQECIKAQDMLAAERRKIVEDCCLRLSHSAKFCRNRPKCIICKKSHFPIVCEGIKEVDNGEPKVSKEGTQHGNHEKIIRALLDSASQKSYILKSTSKEVRYLPERFEPIQHSLFGGYTTEVTNHDVYTIIFFSLEGNYTSSFKVIGHHKICENIAPIPSGPWVQELKLHNIYLSDVNTDGATEILLGADVVGSLLTGNREEVRNRLIAFQTKLGWTLMGKVPNDADN